MSCSNKLRRRLSKKWLTIIGVCGLVDGIAFLLYWRSQQVPLLTIHEKIVHEVDVIYSGDTIAKAQETNIKAEENPPPIEGALPKNVLNQAIGSNKKIGALKSSMKNGQRESALLERMEKSMMREAKQNEQEIARLPKPREILAESLGPVPRIKEIPKASQKTIKLIVIARENTGFPVLGQFLNKDYKFFVHGEPPHEEHAISDLLNCVLTPEIIQTFTDHIKTEFGESVYFKEDCLLDSHSVCNDPLSYETACSSYPRQMIRSKHFSLKLARELLKSNTDLKMIFLVRDPRGVLRNGSSKPQKSCSELSRDLDAALSLITDFPKQFALARYEMLAINPKAEVVKLLENLEIDLPLTGDQTSDDQNGWSVHKNSVQKVNSWKQRLSSNALQKIESQCLETLSKLEYPLLGQGVV